MTYCDRCNRWFGSERALDQHLENSNFHHICDNCHKDFATGQGLTQHYIQSPRHFYCRHCGEHFDDGRELEDHYEEAHWYCSSCSKVFDSERGLEEHRRQSHWYCVSCKRVFQSESNLDTHLRTSAVHNERRHQCPGRNCNRSFISRSDLALHLESGTCRSGLDRHDVNRLAVRYDSSRIITNPSRLIGGVDNSSSSPRVVQAYATERSWNGYAYECPLCHRTFGALTSLNAHLNSPAHDDGIYRCPTQFDGCNTEFRTLSGLMRHVESQRCDIHRFQGHMNRTIDNLTSRMGRIGF